MFSNIFNAASSRIDQLPPLHVSKDSKAKPAWKKAVMDSFESIGIQQLAENARYIDRYRMVNNQISYQELATVIPQAKGIGDLLSGLDIPAFIKHYDLVGSIVKELVGKYMDILDKFHVIDTGELAINDYQQFKNNQIQESLNALFENEINLTLAKEGIDPEKGDFSSPEEQQQYIQMLEEKKKSIIDPSRMKQAEKSYKSIGVKWGETTLSRDQETMDLKRKEKVEFKDYLLTGRCFREHKLYGDMYDSKTWSPINTFISKELDEKLAQNLSYVGRIHLYTPQEVIREYHHLIPTDKAKEILGNEKEWKEYLSGGVASGTIDQALNNNFVKLETVPFPGYHSYNMYLHLQDELGIPMGESTSVKDGQTYNRYLPKFSQNTFGGNTYLSKVLRPDIARPRTDMCQVTEVYFIAYDYVGYLTYETETGNIVTDLVTEDILKDFKKEYGIRDKYKSKIVDNVEDFEVNTIQWFLTENTYYGIKLQSPYLTEPLYLQCDIMDHQIKGASPFRRRLPVAGLIETAPIEPVLPWQAKYNLVLNQVWNLLEKEVGMFFLMDVKLIPDEYMGEDTEESFAKLMDIAKSVGILPVATSKEMGGNNSTFNQFTTYDISYSKQLQERLSIANVCKISAYEAIGVSQSMQQPSKQETATGARIGQEVTFSRLSDIFDTFAYYKKGQLDTHLAVAQYAQSNSKDNLLYWTKSDASIQFLKLTDANTIPLRNIGVLPVSDPRKRLALENFKSMLLQNNTAGADLVELGELFTSESMQELMEAAKVNRKYREEQAALSHQRDQENIKMQQDYATQRDDVEWQREKYKIDSQNQAKIGAASLMATGRAADNQASPEGYQQIQQNTRDQQNALKIENDAQKHQDRIDLETRKHEDSQSFKERELNLKERSLDIKEKQIKSDEYKSQINKN